MDRESLSFSKSDPGSLKAWLDALPAANSAAMVQQLYAGINEINALQTTAQNRFELLNLMRPAIYLCCKGLEKDYLNQPVTMTSRARKIALFAQALQQQLSIGYSVVAVQCSEKMRGFSLSKPSTQMSQAIHHAISDASRVLERNFQLYRPAPDGFWSNIHHLYLLARRFKLENNQVADPQISAEHQSKISGIYHRTLLLGCINANQLRQEDIDIIYDALDAWASQVSLQPVEQDREDNFIIDATLDTPPVYQKFYRGNFNENCHQLDTSLLIEQLQTSSNTVADSGLAKLSKNLINHLIVAWGVLTDRTFMRLEAHDNLELCIGLSTTHFFLSGKRDLEQFIRAEDEVADEMDSLYVTDEEGHHNEWEDIQHQTKARTDVWDNVYEYEGNDPHHAQAKLKAKAAFDSIEFHVSQAAKEKKPEDTKRDKYQNYEVQMVNISPGGYCLEWPGQAPNQLKTEEIIGVKEANHATWSIGCIRWISHPDSDTLQLGIKLLSPTAIPYAAKIIHKTSTSAHMRALLLPKIATIGQPETLLTPSVSFKEGQKVILVQNGEEVTVQLTKQVAGNHSYSQFEFRAKKRISDIKIGERPAPGEQKRGSDNRPKP